MKLKNIIKYLIIFWLSFFILIIFMGATRHVDLNGPRVRGTPKEIILFLASLISNIANLEGGLKPMVLKSNLPLRNGINRSDYFHDNKDYLLVSVWDDKISQCVVKLIRLKDGRELYKWTPNIEELNNLFNSTSTYGIKNRMTKNATRLRHPFLMNDGSLIFSAGGIFKIDKNSKIIWSNITTSHHSIEIGSDGNFWICGYLRSNRNSEKYQISDDAIQKISAVDGSILYEKSVFEILMENGYGRGQFFINPIITSLSSYLDYCHLNDVVPILQDSRYWKRDDLFLSLRHQNMIILYRPSTNKIIWYQQGPWLKQHSIDVIDSIRIGVFGNDVIDANFLNESDRLIDGHNNQYIYDFSKNICYTPYNEFFKSASIGTYTEGRSKIFPNGDIFVEETDKGRILYGNKNEEVWSYVERIDKNHVSLFNWSRYITEKEFRNYTFIDQNN